MQTEHQILDYRSYALTVPKTNTDMLKSSMSVMLKCFAGEAVHVSLTFYFVHNGKVTLYFNGEEKYSVTYECLQTWYGR